MNSASSMWGSKSAYRQLADGRARAMMARDPNCTADNSCPSEYAATNAGAVYDGNPVGASAPQVISAPQVDGTSQVSVPSDAMMQGYQNEADQAEQDAQQCQAADQQYGPEEQSLSAKLQSDGQALQSACSGGCGGGCGSAVSTMKTDCNNYYAVQCKHIMACPLTATDGCPAPDCNR
jgi:hypothetical protein